MTWHPDEDIVCGWSPDASGVLFASAREVGNSRSRQLYQVPLNGGVEQRVMDAVAVEGAWAPDGRRLAYRPTIQAYSGVNGWRQYRGGETPPIWIIDPAKRSFEEIPHVNASDSNPMWIGADVAFISDRNDGAANLFLYDAKTRAVRQLTHETVWDVRHADSDGQMIVYEVGGRLKMIDPAQGLEQALPIVVASDSNEASPHWKDASGAISAAMLSPSGKRVLLSARGQVFTIPAKDGSVRRLSEAGVRDAGARWSRDGRRIAFVSNDGQTQALVLRDALGLEKPVRFALPASGFFRLLDWSPDGQHLALDDSHLHLYAFDVAHGSLELLDTSPRRHPFSVSFSSDGAWLAYTVTNANYLTQVRLHGFADGKNTPLADSLVQSANPVFGARDLLYFTASIDAGPSAMTLDMSTQERPLRSAIYAAVLEASAASPFAPKTGDEEIRKPAAAKRDEKTALPRGKGKAEAAGGGEKPDAPAKSTRVDRAGLADRIVAVPVAERNYVALQVGEDGSLFYLAARQPGTVLEAPSDDEDGIPGDLYRFSLEDRSEKLLKTGVSDFSASADGKKLLLRYGTANMEVADAVEKLDPKPIDLSGARVYEDPRQEWREIFNETCRMEQEFFYDPKMHGLDWKAVCDRYASLLPYVLRRDDLNELLVEMIGEMQVGHNRARNGEVARPYPSRVGLLGADLRVENGQIRIHRILRGDRWNPFLEAPLAAPGLDVVEGDAILAVNGRVYDGSENPFMLFDGTKGSQTTLTVSHDGSTKTAHTIVVKPVGSESALRQWDWVERNRAYVDRQTQGRVAYVFLPDTAGNGFTFFNRMFFGQTDKEALIVDDRRNSGGQAANYVLDVLSRRLLAGWKDRDGLVWHTPAGAIYGPKVMLIDQDAGSGGDFLPYGFRYLGLGKLIGTRTWGGLIGISINPPLLDGGELTVPFFRFFSPDGRWMVENEGVAPDIAVPLDPIGVNEGRDSQLDAAIAEVMAQLRSAPPAAASRAPPYPTQLGK